MTSRTSEGEDCLTAQTTMRAPGVLSTLASRPVAFGVTLVGAGLMGHLAYREATQDPMKAKELGDRGPGRFAATFLASTATSSNVLSLDGQSYVVQTPDGTGRVVPFVREDRWAGLDTNEGRARLELLGLDGRVTVVRSV